MALTNAGLVTLFAGNLSVDMEMVYREVNKMARSGDFEELDGRTKTIYMPRTFYTVIPLCTDCTF